MNDTEEKWELARIIHHAELLRYHQHMRKEFTEAKTRYMPLLTEPQLHMVMTIREMRQMTIKQLTQALQVKAPAASAMVDRLVEQGVLTRETNPEDRREVLVRVSPRDESYLSEVEKRHLQRTVELFDAIGLENARTWANISRRVMNVLMEKPLCQGDNQ